MNWKDFFKPTLSKIGLALFLILMNSLFSDCVGGSCYGFPFYISTGAYMGTPGTFHVFAFIFNIIIYIILSWLVIEIAKLVSKKRLWLNYIFSFVFAWAGMFLLHVLYIMFTIIPKYGVGAIFDPDNFEYALFYTSMKTFLLIPIIALIALIVFIIRKIKKKESVSPKTV